MGIYYKWIEERDGLFRFIRELEINRLDEDLTNVHKLDCLYEVYRNICDAIDGF